MTLITSLMRSSDAARATSAWGSDRLTDDSRAAPDPASVGRRLGLGRVELRAAVPNSWIASVKSFLLQQVAGVARCAA